MPPSLSLGNRLGVEVSDLVFCIDVSHQIRRFRKDFVQPIGVDPVCPMYVSKFGGSALLYDLDHSFVIFSDNELHPRAIFSGAIEVLNVFQPEGPKNTRLAEEFSVPPRWAPGTGGLPSPLDRLLD